MEFKIKGNLRIKINETDNTASVVKSPKATGNIIIPRFAEHKNNKFKISTIGSWAFESCKIESLSFPEDSEVETFEECCFGKASINTLEIGANVKNLQKKWCSSIDILKEIKISQKNHHFILYEKKYLIGKNETGEFNVLYYAIDATELIIPRQVSVIKENAFDNHNNLQSVKFAPKTELKCIEDDAFRGSSITHLSLPASVEKISDSAFWFVKNLQKIEISSENKYFKLIDGDYIVKESKIGSGVFDVIIFVRRDIESIRIPSHIKVINNHAIEYCKLLKTVTFDPNSSLEVLKELAFSSSFCPEKFVLPPSLKAAEKNSLSRLENTKSIEFLGKSVNISSLCFSSSKNISTVTFPNADEVIFSMYAFMCSPQNMKVFVKRNAKLSGVGLKGYEHLIRYIESDTEETESSNEEEPGSSNEEEPGSSNEEEPGSSNEEEPESSNEEEPESNAEMKDLLAKLQQSEEENKKLKEENTKLKEDNKKLKQKVKNQVEQEKRRTPPKLELFEPEMIDGLKVVRTIGRGGQSEVFEVTREQRLALKVLFIEGINKSGSSSSSSSSFKQLQRFLLEYEILSSLSHSNIVKTFGFCYGDSSHAPSILLELCEQNLNDRISSMDAIEKVCCIIEISKAMESVHLANMIHRDLKPENVLFDSEGHVKMSDFGVACIVDVEGQTQSKTSGVGTLKFMAPELLNESTKYDNKVDVYSFGVVLFFILSGGKMPKLSMAEQCLGKKAPIPSNINKVSRELINSCWSTSPSDRPSFTEILNIIKKNKFKLIDGVEKNISVIKSFVAI